MHICLFTIYLLYAYEIQCFYIITSFDNTSIAQLKSATVVSHLAPGMDGVQQIKDYSFNS
jgi:hypothetical protein